MLIRSCLIHCFYQVGANLAKDIIIIILLLPIITGGGAELRGGAEEAGEVHQQPQEDVHTLPRHHHRQHRESIPPVFVCPQLSFIIICSYQCCGSVTLWYGFGSVPLATDPASDPSIFVCDFQDGN